MPTSTRSRRPRNEFDELDEGYEGEFSREVSQEKFKMLLSDLLGRWHWIALGLILGLLAGFYYLSKAPAMYRASSSVVVKQQTASVMGRDQVQEIDLRSIEAFNTLAERMMRPEMLQKVASRPDVRDLSGLMPVETEWRPAWLISWLGEDKSAEFSAPAKASKQPAPPPAVLAGAIAGWTNISVRKGTRLLDISVSHPVPEVARAVADAIPTEYRSDLTGARSESRNSSVEILMRESQEARTRLQAAQNALAGYQRALSTLKELEEKEKIQAELARKYLPKHPKMVAAISELESYTRKFLTEFDAARGAPADKVYWDQHIAELETGADEAAKLVAARRLLLARGTVLESEITSQTSVFNSILTRIQEADINSQADESEMDINSLAFLPSVPVSPQKPKILGMFGAGGVGLGILLALCFIRLDNKLHTVAQAERETGIPTLAAISAITPKMLAQLEKRKSKTSVDEKRAWDPKLVFREGMSSTMFAEMFRVLRASVSLLGDEKQRKVTLFSSALPGEGKTFVSCNFALAAAQQGKRTILVDLDLRKPSVHRLFGLRRDVHPSGSTEVLSGQATIGDSILKDTGTPNLHLMLSGKRAPNPGELLDATKLEEFFQALSEDYDVIVIDSAPLLAVPDTRLIAPIVDNFCLVTRANYVPKGAVRRVIALLEADHDLPVGIVFNGFEEKKRLIGQNYSYGNYQTSRYGKAYRYGYGSYGSYGSEEE